MSSVSVPKDQLAHTDEQSSRCGCTDCEKVMDILTGGDRIMAMDSMGMKHPEDVYNARAKKKNEITPEQAFCTAVTTTPDHPAQVLSSKRFSLFLARHFDTKGELRTDPLPPADDPIVSALDRLLPLRPVEAHNAD